MNTIYILLGTYFFIIIPARAIYLEIQHPKMPLPLFIAGLIGYIIFASVFLSLFIAYYLASRGNNKARNYLGYWSGRKS